jgi:glycosidase
VKNLLTRITLLFLSSLFTLTALGSFRPAALTYAAPQAAADCNIWWNEVLHDTFNSDYRSIVGPTTPGNTVKLRLRVAQSDLTSARVRVWDDRTNSETYYNMAWDGGFDTDPVTYDYWFVNIPVGAQPTALYYIFELNDVGGICGPADQDFYIDDDAKFYGGGYGTMRDVFDSIADSNHYQITVYDPTFTVPAWMQRGVVYQVFPDRFRDGDASNNPATGRFSYNMAGGAIVRSNQSTWNYTVCDPRSTYSPSCANHYGDNFYGGDLQGVIDKIEDGYFDNLGVTVLYLNPIFRAPSNHKYDTANFLELDPDFGDEHNIQIILDGVFNHTSSDSFYFDYYRRYDENGNLVSPTIGTDDDSGACESPLSDFRDWFYIGGDQPDNPTEMCDDDDNDDPGGTWNQEYRAWYGYGSLPKLQSSSAEVRDLFWDDGLNSVGPYWVDQGASGWRFDVGGDVDPGLTHDPANIYWEGFRDAVRDVNPETITLGEEWGDATPWLLGNEWDSVMNYRFRSAVLSWLYTGCTGSGCVNDDDLDEYFEDNDSNTNSSSGAISKITPSQFNARLRSIQEDYPPMAFLAMMNLEGSHDTNRLRFLLRKINNDNDGAAVQRMKEWWLFAFTYAGAPTLYYGDEIGLNHDSVFHSGKWEDDPYNRIPFPWPDASGSTYVADTGLLDFARDMASIRHSYRALQDGDVHHGLIIDDTKQVYGFGRTYGSGSAAATQTALIALNRSGSSQTVSFTGLNSAPHYLPNGTVMVDALSGTPYTVSGGAIVLSINATWGVVLLEEEAIDAPADPTNLTLDFALAPNHAPDAPEADLLISWDSVTADTGSGRETATYYTVHGSTDPDFTPDTGNLLDTVNPSNFGDTGNRLSYTHVNGSFSGFYYAVCAYNAAEVRSLDCPGLTPTAVTLGPTTTNLPARYTWLSAAALTLILLAATLLMRRKQNKQLT